MGKNTWIILQWEYLHRIRSKTFLLSILLPFIIFALALGPQLLATKSETEPEYLVLICNNKALADTIESTFTRNYRLENNRPRYLFSHHNSQLFEETDTLIYQIIHQQIADAVLKVTLTNFDSVQAEIYYETLGLDQINRIHNGLQDAVESYRMEKLRLNKNLLEYIRMPVSLEEFQLTQEGIYSGNQLLLRYITPFVFMFVLILGIITTSQSIISSIIEERTHRIVEILLSTVKPAEIIAGKILGMGFLGLTQIFIYFVILFFLGNHFFPDDFATEIVKTNYLMWYFIFFILGYLMFSTLYVALGALFDNERDAQQLGGVLSLIALIPIYFISFMMEHPESNLTTILSYIPLITPFLMILHIGIMSPSFGHILGMALYLLVWIVLLIKVSSRIFRLSILMYGKRPTFQEILHWNRNISP